MFSIALLFSLIAIGTIGGCGGGGNGDGGGEFAGETNCSDMIDNDGDGEVDCADIDCILDPSCPTCDDFVDAFCERVVECDGLTFPQCVSLVEDFISSLDCEDIEELSTVNECIADLEDFNCEDLFNDLGPDSCAPSEGVCDVCEADEDCGENLICVDCLEDCTGVAKRCVGFFFDQECVDGTFGFIPAP